ncbi:MAG: hypothetical protein JSS69_07075 [Acidobacteria bacterium]|nr:hypothetical protein [Acidobacteriota bacterium]MBS1865666.1 hypothetical protein [Acidobacteriota bacterium]
MAELLQEVEVKMAESEAGPSARESEEGSCPIWVYGLTIALSAFLLFQVQLISGKYLLPLFGGTPAMWSTCMLCFQILLLLGYLYAHALGTQAPARLQVSVHGTLLIGSLLLLAVLWMKWGSPLTPGVSWRPKPGDNQVWKILELLGITVAFPFFLLSTTGPLLQKWYSASGNPGSPYRLYALSNAGSLLGLVSYPFLIEWAFTIRHQTWLWSSAYAVFTVFATVAGWRALGKPQQIQTREYAKVNRGEDEADERTPTASKLGLWLGLSACSTTLLFATTNLLCEDITVIPLLWVVPLSIYLLSFIVTFESSRWYRRSIFWPLYFLAVGVGIKSSFERARGETLFLVATYCVTLFVVCMVCHGELARSRPKARYLTNFYLMVALGGALGGGFVVLIAPRIFLGFWEFQTALIASGILIFWAYCLGDRQGKSEQKLWSLAVIILGTFFVPQMDSFIPDFNRWKPLNHEYYTGPLLSAMWLTFWLIARGRKKAPEAKHHFPWQPVASTLLIALFGVLAIGYAQVAGSHMLFRERNFFGIKAVVDNSNSIALMNGNTVHGVELKSAASRHTPTSYYSEDSGIGLVLKNFPRGSEGKRALRVGLIGMGVGTLAAYGRPNDSLRFYEIDPAVIQLSTGPAPLFHFLSDSPAKIETVLGDARLSLEAEAGRGEFQKFDVLAVDAFTSDSIPAHLLTEEAMGIYLRHLRGTDSMLAFHVSNRYLNLSPVIFALGERYELSSAEVHLRKHHWILLSANPAMFRIPGLAEQAKPLNLTRRPVLWTDDYSNLFQVLMRPSS